ncbi:hypothetical protein FHX37_0804 [Haloactinospora alba]|uniref:Secreted protein n=1 Tax=Haloactinospora alba TaxID=405555 RepID=A0A543NGD6_9ACTN|nr:hypothetical protein [Haloactinospora alba]TQN30916.1 hypothetical protein FHX37_0804 [Haloactinospora alba]
MTVRTAGAVATVALLVLTGCVESDDGADDNAAETPGPSGTDGETPYGGPTPLGEGEQPDLDIGGVVTEAAANDTVELATRGAGTEDAMDATEWETRFRITFDGAQREGTGVTFTGQAEYLGDTGGYLLHSHDIRVLVPTEGGDGRGEDGESPEEGYETFTAAEPAQLATLTPENPDEEFSVTIADVPPEPEGRRNDDGTVGRFVKYRTPPELWGHTVEAPPDFTPGRLCYFEGEEWHDIPLFDYTDYPCG